MRDNINKMGQLCSASGGRSYLHWKIKEMRQTMPHILLGDVTDVRAYKTSSSIIEIIPCWIKWSFERCVVHVSCSVTLVCGSIFHYGGVYLQLNCLINGSLDWSEIHEPVLHFFISSRASAINGDYRMTRFWYRFYSRVFVRYRERASLRASEWYGIKNEWIKTISGS